jgi:hypothetical protein
LALLPIYVAGGTFFMILHLNTTALTKWADADTDRHTANVFDLLGASQDALPSYFRNAGPDVPRPARETLLVVDPQVARMFGTSRIDAAAVQAVQQAHPELQVVVTDGAFGDLPKNGDKGVDRRATNVYPPGAVTVKQVSDSHGVPTIAVDVAQGVDRLARVAFVRKQNDLVVPVLLVDQKVFDDVYRRTDASTPTLPAGQYLRVTSPEVFQAANAICVIGLTTPLVLFWLWMQRRGRTVGTANKIFYGLLLTMLRMEAGKAEALVPCRMPAAAKMPPCRRLTLSSSLN